MTETCPYQIICLWGIGLLFTGPEEQLEDLHYILIILGLVKKGDRLPKLWSRLSGFPHPSLSEAQKDEIWNLGIGIKN